MASAIVQPLALIIHELASNALVHGALSKPEGRLILNWERTDEFGGFRLTWTEDSAPAPISDPKLGVGTTIVKALVEKQLGGSMRRVWKDARLHIHVDVPGFANKRLT